MVLTSRIRHWSKVLGAFVSVQLAVQAMGFFGGVLVIRLLDHQEYAYFTIANTMQGTMALLTDLGISISLMSIGGKVWNDRVAFSRLFTTARKLRNIMALAAGAVIVPLSLWMLLRQGAGPLYTFLILAVVAAGFTFQVSSGIYVVVLRLHSRIKELQIADFLSAASRLLCLGAFSLLFLNAALALATALMSFGIQAWLLRRWGREVVDHEAEPDPEYRISMLKVVANQAPSGIYYCFQSQIAVWLLSTFGKAESVAQFGALGRLALIFSLVGGILNNIVLPSFSRCHDRTQLVRRYWQIMGVYAAFCAVLVTASIFFSDQFLWILGKQYAGLNQQFFWIVLSTVVSSLAVTMFSINSSRGWIEYAWLYIPCTLVTQACLLTVLDVSTVQGAIFFGLWSNLSPLLVNVMLTWRGFAKMLRDEARAV